MCRGSGPLLGAKRSGRPGLQVGGMPEVKVCAIVQHAPRWLHIHPAPKEQHEEWLVVLRLWGCCVGWREKVGSGQTRAGGSPVRVDRGMMHARAHLECSHVCPEARAGTHRRDEPGGGEGPILVANIGQMPLGERVLWPRVPCELTGLGVGNGANILTCALLQRKPLARGQRAPCVAGLKPSPRNWGFLRGS